MVQKDLNVAVSGELMMTRRISVYEDPEFLAWVKIFRDADVAITNIEGFGFANFKGYCLGGNTPMTGKPEIADDIKWAGFNLVSIANNHAMDYLEGGLLSAIEQLDRVGIVYAGAGKNLTEARESGYLETRKGRVAMVATTSSMSPGKAQNTMATEDGKGLPGKPGVNLLRYNATYTVTPSTLKELEEIDYKGAVGEAKFVAGDKPGAEFTLFKLDSEAVLREIKEAKRQASWVIYSNHSHQRDKKFGSEWMDYATGEFIRRFYRDCIDAGADFVYGHGNHMGEGIEIYKGRPIFYGFANPISTSTSVSRFPLYAYQNLGLDYNSTPTDWLLARHQTYVEDSKKLPTGSSRGYANDRWLQCVLATFTLNGDHGKPKEIKLIPVDGTGGEWGFPDGGGAFDRRGIRPFLAKGELAKKILERYAKMSEPFGTEVTFKDGIGIINL